MKAIWQWNGGEIQGLFLVEFSAIKDAMGKTAIIDGKKYFLRRDQFEIFITDLDLINGYMEKHPGDTTLKGYNPLDFIEKGKS